MADHVCRIVCCTLFAQLVSAQQYVQFELAQRKGSANLACGVYRWMTSMSKHISFKAEQGVLPTTYFEAHTHVAALIFLQIP